MKRNSMRNLSCERRRKVLLITPPYHCGVVESAGTWMPLSFVYLGGAARAAGYDVEIYDAMSKFHAWPEITKHIEESKPDVIATGAITATINDCIRIFEIAKLLDPGVVTVVGGVHSNFQWREVIENNGAVDYVVRGEGELTFPELLDCHFAGGNLNDVQGIAYRLDKQAVATESRPFLASLSGLPMAWDLIEWQDYSYRPTPGSTLAVVSYARGCVQACSFCSQQLFWKQTWRSRRPDDFVDELELLRDAYGVNVAMIADEAPTTGEKDWHRLLDLLIERDLGVEILLETRVTDICRDEHIMDRYTAAGINHIYVGVESGSQDQLDRFNKNIKVAQSKKALDLINAANIISETSFVLGMPEDNRESIKETVKLAKYYNPDLAFFLAIAPWPYAKIYPELKPYIESYDYSLYNLVEPVIKPRAMTRDEVSKELFNAFKNFYMGKMAQLPKMTKFKRDYMIAVAKLLATHSYLADQMKGLATGMPAKAHTMLADLMGEKVG